MKKISVVIPTYNRKKVIMNAINSVLAQNLSNWDWEIVVSDDGSTDGTFEMFSRKNKRVRYFFNKINKGVNAARNFGIKKAKGDYVLFLDSDDVLTPDCFATLEEFEKRGRLSSVNLFGCAEMNTYRKMFHISEERTFDYREWLQGRNISGEFLSVVKRDVFKKDLFDEERFCFERFFWNRVIKNYGAFASPKVMRLYSFEQENRVSKALLKPENAAKRYVDYAEYLKRFGQDYIDFKLHEQYADLLFRVGAYALLSRNVSEGRKLLSESLKYNFSFRSLILRLMSYLGYSFTRAIYFLFISVQEY